MSNSVDVQPSQNTRSYHSVIKAVGSRCNLECGYCYYRGKEKVLPGVAQERMSEELLETFTRQFINDQDGDTILFNWHGGEPALAGLDFYRKAVELQKKYANGKRIENDFQTNGTLLNDQWCEFFKENNFWVGLSIDGPKHLHDQLRRGKGDTPTFDRVYQASQLLRKHEVEFNALAVISSINSKHPREVYQFLTGDLGCRRIQWLPCVQHQDSRHVAHGYLDDSRIPIKGATAARPGSPDSVVTDWSVDPDDWGEFLCQTLDLWLQDGLGRITVNWFESLVGQWMRKPALICTLAETCGRSLVTIEADGSVYSCDHFVYPEHKLGNITEPGSRLVNMVYSPQQQEFGLAKHNGLPDDCRQCKYRFACNGECPKNRIIKTASGQPGLNYLCSGIKRFLAHAEPAFHQLAARSGAALRASESKTMSSRNQDNDQG